VDKGGQMFAVHTDHVGTPGLLTDAADKPVWQWPYSAFGSNKPVGVLQRVTTEGGARMVKVREPVIEFDLRFPGQYFDLESGLAYNHRRFYVSAQARYGTPDPIGLSESLNRFLYVSGNALTRIDPSGLNDFTVQFDAVSGTLWVTPPGATEAQGFPAGNNTTSTSRGPWAAGTFGFSYTTSHNDDGPNSAYGSNGNVVFNVPGCVGCGVHSGRESSVDKRQGSGVNYVTLGCIRSTDAATQLLHDLIKQGHTPVLQVNR
jgi:RHS repeat-associated protein